MWPFSICSGLLSKETPSWSWGSRDCVLGTEAEASALARESDSYHRRLTLADRHFMILSSSRQTIFIVTLAVCLAVCYRLCFVFMKLDGQALPRSRGSEAWHYLADMGPAGLGPRKQWVPSEGETRSQFLSPLYTSYRFPGRKIWVTWLLPLLL